MTWPYTENGEYLESENIAQYNTTNKNNSRVDKQTIIAIPFQAQCSIQVKI